MTTSRDGTNDAEGPYHEGERLVQARAGTEKAAAALVRMVASRIPVASLPFLARQQVLAAALPASDGLPMLGLLFGDAGFVHSHDGTALVVNLQHARVDPEADEALVAGTGVGLLAIDFETGRRLRINGTVGQRDADRVVVAVNQAFPNCTKYVPRRALLSWEARASAAATVWHADVGANERRLIGGADSVFVASRHPERGYDASFRGGEAGFITVDSEGRLRVPDYAGNGMFSTLGNIAVAPEVALSFLDFVSGAVVQVRGRAALDAAAETSTGAPARRAAPMAWTCTPSAVRTVSLPAVVKWLRLEGIPGCGP